MLRIDPGDIPADRRALATGVRSALASLSRGTSVVVAVDDVQWLDTDSAAVLEFVLRRRVVSAFTGRIVPVPTRSLEAPRSNHLCPESERGRLGIYTMRYNAPMSEGSELIKRARRQAGMTQAELARRAGTSQSAVAAYESGAKAPTVDTLVRLLEATGQQLGTRPVPSQSRSTRLGRLIRNRRAAIIRIAAEHHASNVRVFGSVARGGTHAGSDLDLLVDMDGDASLLDQVRLRRALIELLGIEVDVVTSGSLEKRDAAILAEAVAL